MKKIENNNGKKIKKSSDPWARSGERPGRGHGSELFFCFFVFLFFPLFFSVWPKPREHKRKSSDPRARSGLSTHKPKKNKKTRNKKNKKTKNQETKKKQKKKNKIAHPKGRGQMQSVGSCLFGFFCFFCFLFFCFFWFFCFLFFLVFWFFGFLVCVWIAIADVPSRDCQALSVVALEARSIHYSTAMFTMT